VHIIIRYFNGFTTTSTTAVQIEMTTIHVCAHYQCIYDGKNWCEDFVVWTWECL